MIRTSFNGGWTCEVYGKKEEVTLPHDYMTGNGRRGDSPTGPDIGFFEPGNGVYRKTFKKPEQKDASVVVETDVGTVSAADLLLRADHDSP